MLPFVFFISLILPLYVVNMRRDEVPDLNVYRDSIYMYGSGADSFMEYMRMGYDIIPSLWFSLSPLQPVSTVLALPLVFWLFFLNSISRNGIIKNFQSQALVLSFIFSGTFLNLIVNQSRSGAAIFFMMWILSTKVTALRVVFLCALHFATGSFLVGLYLATIKKNKYIVIIAALSILFYLNLPESRYIGYFDVSDELRADGGASYRVLSTLLISLPMFILRHERKYFYFIAIIILVFLYFVSEKSCARLSLVFMSALTIEYIRASNMDRRINKYYPLPILANLASLYFSSLL